ncbi:MAG TPA: hypothetical protein P5509_01560, partial [Bacteroidales bacterium]|nr:hypothetical protein [Bacteroidales bacterium]
MKAKILIPIAFIIFASSCSTMYYTGGEFDDVYYSPSDSKNNTEAMVNDDAVNTNKSAYENVYEQEFESPDSYESISNNESVYEDPTGNSNEEYYYDEDGNLTVNNYYIDDYYEDSYASRLNRFHDYYYYDPYFDPYWNIGFNYSWGYPYYSSWYWGWG